MFKTINVKFDNNEFINKNADFKFKLNVNINLLKRNS